MTVLSHESPIFIIGAGRSGTTVLSRIIAQSPEVFNGYEFRYIWNYRTPFRGLDLRLPESSDSRSVSYIRRFFTKLSDRQGKIILDKTPSNAWRIPFIRSVFPNAKFIHVVRDGRANVASRYREWIGIRENPARAPNGAGQFSGFSERMEILGKRIRLFQARRRIGAYPTDRLPAVFMDNAWPTFSQLVLRRPVRFGERTPGLEMIRKQCGVLVAAAYQWRDSVSLATIQGRELPENSYLEVKFESLIANPVAEVRRVFGMLRISGFGAASEYASSKIRKHVTDSWRSAFNAEDLMQIRPIIEPAMSFVGYEWD